MVLNRTAGFDIALIVFQPAPEHDLLLSHFGLHEPTRYEHSNSGLNVYYGHYIYQIFGHTTQPGRVSISCLSRKVNTTAALYIRLEPKQKSLHSSLSWITISVSTFEQTRSPKSSIKFLLNKKVQITKEVICPLYISITAHLLEISRISTTFVNCD